MYSRLRLVPIERSFDIFFKCHLFFVPKLTRSIFLPHMRESMQTVMSIEGLKIFLQKLRQHVAAEYLNKQYQSLSRPTEAGIVAGEGHKKYLEKKQTI